MWMSTFAFTMLFAVWLMLGVLGLEIKKDTALMLGADAAATLSPDQIKAAVESRFEWLLATAILAGSLLRLNFGIWADKFGGRNMMILLLLLSAGPAYALSHAATYTQLLVCAALAGGVMAWSRPWRWLLTPALLATVLPQLAARTFNHGAPVPWLKLLTSLTKLQTRPDAVPGSKMR